jgi:hypothetical protein
MAVCFVASFFVVRTVRVDLLLSVARIVDVCLIISCVRGLLGLLCFFVVARTVGVALMLYLVRGLLLCI